VRWVLWCGAEDTWRGRGRGRGSGSRWKKKTGPLDTDFALCFGRSHPRLLLQLLLLTVLRFFFPFSFSMAVVPKERKKKHALLLSCEAYMAKP
jgi:hypothetical protein